MATRYIAIVTHEPAANGAFLEAIAPLQLPYSVKSGSISVHSDSPLVTLAGNLGAVVGDLFTRQDHPVLVGKFDDRESQAIRNTAGELLMTGYWGGYVAFIEDGGGVAHVVRDPSAGMPCYFLHQDNARIFASDVDLLVDAGFLKPRVDFEFLARHLYAPDIRTHRTGLIGLQELMAGFRMSIRPTADIISQVWSPWSYCQPDLTRSDSDLAEHLEQVVLGCVGAWARRYPRSLLGVSGGLDSSIVAASLVAAGADVTCLTLATDEAEGDERPFARILRDAIDVPLIEALHRSDLVDFTRALSAYLPRPIGHAFAQSNFGIRFALETELGIDAFFSGVGGDNVFCFTQSATALVDRFRSQGLGWGLIETLDDICRQNNASVGAVLKMAFKRYLRSDPAHRFHGDATFLGPAASHLRDFKPDHPWLHPPKGALPGKAVHVAMLTSIQGTIDGLPRDHAPQILPLLSQPIVEACLGIPMWKWIAGGRNRSVARAAFSGRLPKTLIDRQSKGGPDSFAYTLMEQHKDLVRERLTKGRLADAGLIDLKAIGIATDPAKLIKPTDHMRLSDLAEAEAWVRHWQTT